MTPPAVEVRLEYPRQTIAITSYTDINNFASLNKIVAIDVALQDIISIIINHCREFSERLTMIVMLQKIENYIYEHIDELTSVKNLYLVFVTVMAIILAVGANHLMNRHDVAIQYIHELEEVIEADGTIVGDVCGGDGYAEWYSGM